jgi:hypothetical protein
MTPTPNPKTKRTKKIMSISLEDGVPMVSFAMNRGKGSGAQVMPVADFREYVDTLSDYSDNGIDEIPTADLSPSETVRSTIGMDDEGVISFRVRSGKGAKPAKVASGEFAEVTELLRGTLEPVETAAARLSGAPAEALEEALEDEADEDDYSDDDYDESDDE